MVAYPWRRAGTGSADRRRGRSWSASPPRCRFDLLPIRLRRRGRPGPAAPCLLSQAHQANRRWPARTRVHCHRPAQANCRHASLNEPERRCKPLPWLTARPAQRMDQPLRPGYRTRTQAIKRRLGAVCQRLTGVSTPPAPPARRWVRTIRWQPAIARQARQCSLGSCLNLRSRPVLGLVSCPLSGTAATCPLSVAHPTCPLRKMPGSCPVSRTAGFLSV